MTSAELLFCVLIVLMGVYGIAAVRVGYVATSLILFVAYVFGVFLIV